MEWTRFQAARGFVAQVSNLLFRRFLIGNAHLLRSAGSSEPVGGLETRDTAGWNLRYVEVAVYSENFAAKFFALDFK
jgi:hypothetical protein